MIGVDTTFLIHLLRGEKNALQKALELDRYSFVFTTEINVYELVSGIRESRVDVQHALQDLEILLARFTVLPLDRRGAVYAGRIASQLTERGQMIGDADCLTAGILLRNGCERIVTRNVKHFKRVEDLEVENY